MNIFENNFLSVFVLEQKLSTPICQKNERYTLCTNPCQPSCEQPNRKLCPILRCSTGCVCDQGYLRASNNVNSPCIKCPN